MVSTLNPQKDFKVLETFISIVVLAFLFSQSFIRVPSFAINFFAFILTNIEPLIVFIEVSQMVRLITSLGQYLADRANSADSKDSQQFITKCVVLFITCVSYSLSFFTLRYSLTNAQTLLFT